MKNVSDIVESNGKTIKENNLELTHKFEVATEVLYKDVDGNIHKAVVEANTRDCDGTPLYSVAILVNGVSESQLESFKDWLSKLKS